jgi:hypothetical protein
MDCPAWESEYDDAKAQSCVLEHLKNHGRAFAKSRECEQQCRLKSALPTQSTACQAPHAEPSLFIADDVLCGDGCAGILSGQVP